MKEKLPTIGQIEHEPEKRESVFEIKHHFGGLDIRVDVRKGGKPFEGSIDFVEGKAEVRLTPESVKKGIEAAGNFLNKPEAKATIEGWTEKIRAASRRLREERLGGKEGASQVIRKYAQQEGKMEAEVLDELLKEIAQEESNQ